MNERKKSKCEEVVEASSLSPHASHLWLVRATAGGVSQSLQVTLIARGEAVACLGQGCEQGLQRSVGRRCTVYDNSRFQ
ncbi:hypothetical protein SESBI_22621 [Sesbania bispinosa]|nr:hypothetical protein SESBI_22621 [Sesbania bispinosa]